MKNFNDRGRERGGFKPRGAAFRGPVTMHQATCAKCGQSCEVPFRPSGDKPVFCSNCFKRDGATERSPRFERSRENRSFAPVATPASRPDNDGIKRQLEAVNHKLDQLITLLSRPIEAEPVIIKKVVKKKTVTK